MVLTCISAVTITQIIELTTARSAQLLLEITIEITINTSKKEPKTEEWKGSQSRRKPCERPSDRVSGKRVHLEGNFLDLVDGPHPPPLVKLFVQLLRHNVHVRPRLVVRHRIAAKHGTGFSTAQLFFCNNGCLGFGLLSIVLCQTVSPPAASIVVSHGVPAGL